MKIIDLLNKIANGEELPEEIRFEGKIFEKQDETSFYCTGFGVFEEAFVLEDLNKEVEIIEEDREIEKINYYATNRVKNEFAVDYIENGETKKFCLNKKQRYFADKINKLIDKVNNMENNK